MSLTRQQAKKEPQLKIAGQLQADKMIALVGRAGPTIELHKSLEPGAAVEIITETGLDPLNPIFPRSLAALAVVYVAIVDTTVAQRVVGARTEFVFALDIAAAMAKMPFG